MSILKILKKKSSNDVIKLHLFTTLSYSFYKHLVFCKQIQMFFLILHLSKCPSANYMTLKICRRKDSRQNVFVKMILVQPRCICVQQSMRMK